MSQKMLDSILSTKIKLNRWYVQYYKIININKKNLDYLFRTIWHLYKVNKINY